MNNLSILIQEEARVCEKAVMIGFKTCLQRKIARAAMIIILSCVN